MKRNQYKYHNKRQREITICVWNNKTKENHGVTDSKLSKKKTFLHDILDYIMF